MKRLLSVLALSAGVTLSGCSSLDSMNDTAVTDESIAVLEQAINEQKKDAEVAGDTAPQLLPPPIVPPLDIQTLGKTSEERFEDFGLEMQLKMRAGFLELAKAAPSRFAVIDAGQAIEAVAADTLKALKARL